MDENVITITNYDFFKLFIISNICDRIFAEIFALYQFLPYAQDWRSLRDVKVKPAYAR
jgi:hypothetical protein